MKASRYRHVLCVYPYRNDLKRARCFPPIGLEIIASILKPLCSEIDVVDLRHDRGQATDFLRPETDMVCFSVNWDRDADFVREQIRSIGPGRLVVVGGRHATEIPEEWLRDCPNIDILVRGDGEEVIAEIARGRPLESIEGISYRRNGEIVHTANRDPGPIRDDTRPERSLRRTRYEIDVEGVGTGITFDTIMGSRGCPFNCKFCSFSLNPWGNKRRYSARSPESVVDELAGIDADWVAFVDDIFTHDMDRVEAICDLIIKRGIRKHYIVNYRVEAAGRIDVLRKMEQAGFAMLLLGLESAHDKTLRSMSKGFDVATLEKRFAILRGSRMILNGYFILGCIGESEQDMLEIAPFARRLGVDTIALSPLRTVPHDGLRQLVADSPGYHISPKGFVYSDSVSLQDLRRIRRTIWRRFYTPAHVIRLLWKSLRSGIVTPKTSARLVLASVRGWLRRCKHRRDKRNADKKNAAVATEA